MSMNIYIDLDDLKHSMKYIELSVASSATELDGRHDLEIIVTVKHKESGITCIGDLEFGQKPAVCFGRSHQASVISLCTKVGIPFRFF